ncbi:MAG: monovalent cation/H+ antiporter subunit D family protein, partial [Polyangiaceae bacterium]|nr:monovalent cation/H+ antiporter subunit D family protein [Polyangiaceae bacterium]
LRADSLSLLFVTLSAVLWLVTTVYAVGYLEGSPHRSRFFGFFSISVTSTMGVALAGNLLTFFVFYEMLTLSTYPLVVHRGTPESLRAGDLYLRYTFFGGALLLAGVAALYALAGSLEFTEGGALPRLAAQDRSTLIVIFVLLIAGLGVKAALFPLHAWLPVAMVAPAPVSALLHAVAVVKAGAFGITRVVYDVYGIRLARDLGVTRPLAFLAAATILYGSFKALRQDDLKLRLAYSTVSQVSYIILGVAVVGTLSTVGGLVHLVHQGLMKITLFFCAGNLAAELGLHKVSELRGVGRRMPWTMGAFTLASLGMIGIPPTAGFVTKWYLATGAVAAGEPWVLGVLVV